MQVGDTILELDGQRVDHDAFTAGLAAARRAKRSVQLLIASPRVAKERYLESLPTTTVVHDFSVARLLGIDSLLLGRAEVVAVNKGSKAESYGMQVGDTILELDGHIVDADAFNAGMAAARREKRTVRLLIARASPVIAGGGDASEGRGRGGG